jgi:hypothetical protein
MVSIEFCKTTIVWETALHDLPLVKPKIKEILGKE